MGLLVALGFTMLLLPSGLAALGGYRDVVLGVYGGCSSSARRPVVRAKDRSATRSVAIFALARNVDRGRSIAFFSGRRAR